MRVPLHHTAVGTHRLAIDPAAIRPREESHGARNVLGLTEALYRATGSSRPGFAFFWTGLRRLTSRLELARIRTWNKSTLAHNAQLNRPTLERQRKRRSALKLLLCDYWCATGRSS